MNTRKNQAGFSLIELLIVVVVLGIIAAIAIPNLLASRRSANEASTIASLRSYHSAQATYQNSIGAGNFAGVPFSTNGFAVLAANRLLDENLGSGEKSGYILKAHSVPITGDTPACHLGWAYPANTGDYSATGTRTFVIAGEGVMNSGPSGGPDGYAGTTGLELCTVNPAYTPLNK